MPVLCLVCARCHNHVLTCSSRDHMRQHALLAAVPIRSGANKAAMHPAEPRLQAMESKLRYAIYNCVAIDIDTQPW